MTKRDFIWLTIRFTGVAMLALSLRHITSIVGGTCVAAKIIWPTEASEYFILLSLLWIISEGVVYFAIALYLLFFGKLICALISRFTKPGNETHLQKTELAEMLIRLIGVIWLWKLIKAAFAFVFKVIKLWFLANLNLFTDNDIAKELAEAVLSKMRTPPYEAIWMYLGPIANVLLCAALTWYFLKHGKLFINLLNRIWLKTPKQAQPMTVEP